MSVEETRRIILITGTPAVGKTTVSSLLASKLNATHIDLAELVKREDLASGQDKQRDTLIVNTEDLSKTVQTIIKASRRDFIVDGHYAIDTVPPKDINLVFVLRRSPDELKKAMEDRGFGEEKLRENLAAEILDICLWEAVSTCGHDKVCEVNVTGREIKEVVEEVTQILQGKVECRVGIVDWLGKLDKEERLQDFFSVSELAKSPHNRTSSK